MIVTSLPLLESMTSSQNCVVRLSFGDAAEPLPSAATCTRADVQSASERTWKR